VVITEIQGLRPFTRHYGFARGESLVGVVADLLLELARQEPDGLAGRLGAQDFIALVPPAQADGFTAALRSAFDARRSSLYDAVDVLRGWIDVTDRLGRTRRHRPVRLAIGVATSEPPHGLHHLDLLERAAELAEYARTAANGPIAFDRRA
jgi:GGDEF domain-containing protein